MGFLSFLDPALNFIFGPVIRLGPFWAVVILSLLISLIIVVIYKYTTDQNLMKQLKEEIKEFQKEMKELKEDPKKVMEVQKKATQTNMKYMMHSLKPTLITFIPIIIIFGWLNANLAYEPIMPNQEFSVFVNLEKGTSREVSIDIPEGIELTGDQTKEISDGQAIFTMKGKEGEYLLSFDVNEKNYGKEILIDTERYADPRESIKDGTVDSIVIDNKPLKIINLFGWKIGWLGSYIIFSIVFSMLLRKLLKVY